MPSREEDSHSLGGSGKFALERRLPRVYEFLEKSGLDIADIVKMGEAGTNGHPAFRIWIGTPIKIKNVEELNEETILRAGGTGCLEVTVGQKVTTTLIRLGCVVVQETTEPRGIDPRQGKMDI